MDKNIYLYPTEFFEFDTMESRTLQDFLDFTLIKLGAKINITVLDLIEIGIIIIVSILVLALIKKAIYRSKHLEIGKKYSINNLIRYIVLFISISLILSSIGLDLRFTLAGSAALLVGVGLGLQNLFSDFVSGIIILADSSVKVGDIVDVDGLVCQVQEINFRTTLVLTRDDKFILLPNTLLTKNKLVNWTHSIENSRFEVDVRTHLNADVEKVITLLEEACVNTYQVLDEPKPFIRLNNFGEFALEFTVYFWTENIFRVENVKSDLRRSINKIFRENNIEIPFPQHVLHRQNGSGDIHVAK